MDRRTFMGMALAAGALGCRVGAGATSSSAEGDESERPPSGPAVDPASRSDPAVSPTALPEPRTALQRRAEQLQAQYGRRGFAVRVEEPFVVLGDEDMLTVARRSKATIRWAVDRLRAQYFERDPDAIVAIWLLSDAPSFERLSRELTGEAPGTPYGFYTPTHQALIMNIATGGGTLVHELVHPFIESNFPSCPAWFNEGLASLYEQCGELDGKIWGYTNWRLAGLQDALRSGSVPSFSTLTGTSSQAFYEDDPGTNYAQARYLCYYLQEQGLLAEYYHRFAEGRDRDPTGYTTLQAVLRTPDMDTFRRNWESFVQQLQFS